MPTFVQRRSKYDPSVMWGSPYWYSSINPFQGEWRLPNCTNYAYGRILELGGQNLTLSHGDAGMWYQNTGDGYQRGQTPVQGAVACWYCGGSIGSGHVAVVEEVIGTDIIISDSDYVSSSVTGDKGVKENVWDNPHYFGTSRMSPPYGFYGSAGYYSFQGFIYVPIQGGIQPVPTTWISRNDFLSQDERNQNAVTFYYKMSSLGATYNAIIAMLANIDKESTVNPGIWEGLTVGTGGYGLTQWTPYTKYSDWAGAGWEDNGDKECERILYEAQNGLQWFDNPYAVNVGYPVTPPISLIDFMHEITLDPVTLANYWLLYYEHPSESNIPNRMAEHAGLCALYEQVIRGLPPSPHPTPQSPDLNKMPMSLKVNKTKFMEKRGIKSWR